MDKLNYGNYNASISDIAFSSTNGYSDPASELETRKQLSYPLKEVKDFVNNTVSVDHEDNPIQLVLSAEGKLQYRTSPDGELIDIGGVSIDSVYPVGSIYMSVNNTNPSTLFPDTTWVQKSSVMLASNNIFGNGKALDVNNGSAYSLGSNTSGGNSLYVHSIGTNAGSTGGVGNALGANYAVGVATKEQLGANPENSGLIADTITIYTWERTA